LFLVAIDPCWDLLIYINIRSLLIVFSGSIDQKHNTLVSELRHFCLHTRLLPKGSRRVTDGPPSRLAIHSQTRHSEILCSCWWLVSNICSPPTTILFCSLCSILVQFEVRYDGTIRRLSFVSGISQEIFSSEHLITSMDLPVGGHEMWISDSSGGLTHLDLREPKDKACRYSLSAAKIGTVSINPTSPHFLLMASNSRELK